MASRVSTSNTSLPKSNSNVDLTKQMLPIIKHGHGMSYSKEIHFVYELKKKQKEHQQKRAQRKHSRFLLYQLTSVKSVILGLDRLRPAVAEDREDTEELRNLSHKLLILVNDGDGANKAEASTKASLNVILQILENTSDQATILALVGALTEVVKGGGAPAKRLTTHDASRTLLQVLATHGDKFSYRTLLSVISLISKVGAKDKKFGLRARLTGALAPLLSAIRSSYNHPGHHRLLSLSLNVIRIALTSSPTNSTVLGRHGGINILYKVIQTLNRKQQSPLKNALTSFNIMVKNSKLNSSRAVGLGVVSLMLTMHQEYHRLDFRHERNLVTRKSVLNILKNVLSSKSGRMAFSEADGLKILMRTCKDYLKYVNPSKNTIMLMNVATLIMTRCQPKRHLPVPANVCSFSFDLAGVQGSDENLSSVLASDEQGSFDLDDSDDDADAVNDDDDDDEGVKSNKNSGGADSDGDDDTKLKSNVSGTNIKLPVTRMYEDLKMYERFFLELTDFPIDHIERARLSTSEQMGSKGKDANTVSVNEVKATPKRSLPDFASQQNEYSRRSTAESSRFDVELALGRAAVQSSSSHRDQRISNTPQKLRAKNNLVKNEVSTLSLFKKFVASPASDSVSSSPAAARKKKSEHVVSKKKNSSKDLSNRPKSPNQRPKSPKQGSKSPNQSPSQSNRSSVSVSISNKVPSLGETDNHLINTVAIASEINVTPLQLLQMQRVYRTKMALIASNTTSIKGGINRLSLADEQLLQPCQKLESLLPTKQINRLIRIRIISDLRRLITSQKNPPVVVYDSTPNSELVGKGLSSNLLARRKSSGSSSSKKSSGKGTKLGKSKMLIAEKPSSDEKVPLSIPTGRLTDMRVKTIDLFRSMERERQASVSSTASGCNEVNDLNFSKDLNPTKNYWNPYDNSNSLEDENYGNDSLDSPNNSNGSLFEQIVLDSFDSELSSDDGALGPAPALHFNSDFESGNLRSAVRTAEFEYELIINADCNTSHHFQWFYFEIASMLVDQPYVFNIINCEKEGSSFNEGMQPVMFSAIEARRGRPFWRRVGRDICYYRNNYLKPSNARGSSRCYFTASFTVTFQHEGDICYLAYHYPYTYSKLQMDLDTMIAQVDQSKIFVHRQVLCQTLSGNDCPVLTITAMPSKTQNMRAAKDELRSRPYVFLTARVHPGETNASWTMRGTLQILLTSQQEGEEATPIHALADDLRKTYIFKIVPMLNPDGVINGHHRTSLSGNDLNRQWTEPNPLMHPTIFHTKGLLQYLQAIHKPPIVYCDYHGHSRKMNVFMYGCNIQDSIDYGEGNSVAGAPDDSTGKMVPRLLQHLAPTFAIKNCSWVVDRGKLSTARVVVWKEFGVARSYTMESTYNGCDQGDYKGKQVNISIMEIMGSQFCECLMMLKDRNDKRSRPIKEDDEEDLQGKKVNSNSSLPDAGGSNSRSRNAVNDDTGPQMEPGTGGKKGSNTDNVYAPYVNECGSGVDVVASPSPPPSSLVNSDAELTPDEDSFSPNEFADADDDADDTSGTYFVAEVVSSHLLFETQPDLDDDPKEDGKPFVVPRGSGSSTNGCKVVELAPLENSEFSIPSDLPFFKHGMNRKGSVGKSRLAGSNFTSSPESSFQRRALQTTAAVSPPGSSNQPENADYPVLARPKPYLANARSNISKNSKNKKSSGGRLVNKRHTSSGSSSGSNSFPRPFESTKPGFESKSGNRRTTYSRK